MRISIRCKAGRYWRYSNSLMIKLPVRYDAAEAAGSAPKLISHLHNA